MPSARRLSQTLGVYGLVAHSWQSKLGSPRFRCVALLCQARLLESQSCLVIALPVTIGAGRPSRFAGGQRTARCPPSISWSRLSASSKQAWAFRANRVASFGHAGLAVQAPIFGHFMRLPVSQRLKPQSSMFERFCTSPFASVAQHVCRSLGTQGRRISVPISSSKQERAGSQQTPNPSFKRTCLRQAA